MVKKDGWSIVGHPNSSLLEKYQEKGISLRQTVATSVQSRYRITERLKGAGVELRPHNPHRRKSLSDVQIMELMENMRSKGKTYREIAEELTRLKEWHPMMVQRALMTVVMRIAT